MIRISYLPGELLVNDTIEDKRGAAIIKPWLPDLYLAFGSTERTSKGFRIPIQCTGRHPHLEEHLWLALEARDHLWASLLVLHLTNPADLYEILEVIAISPKPESFLQGQTWLSARYLLGM